MNTLESDIRAHLRRAASGARPAHRLADVRAARPSAPVSRPALATRLLPFVAAVVLVVGGGWLALSRQRNHPATVPPPGAVDLSTKEVTLTAERVTIEVNGKVFTPTKVELSSDPGDGTSQTLEVLWHQGGVEMRWNLYFGADTEWWWISEMRTYDCNQQGEWLTYFIAPQKRTRLGTAYTGDIDYRVTDHGVTGRLLATGVSLQPFRPVVKPADTVVPVAVPARVPERGLGWTKSTFRTVAFASLVECLTAAGADDAPTQATEYVDGAGPVDSPPLWEMGDPRRTGFHALRADQNSAPNGCADTTNSLGGSYQRYWDAAVALNSHLVDGSGPSAASAAVADTRMRDALATWQRCLRAATGSTAATPHGLAMLYVQRPVSVEEIHLAVASAACEESARLWETWRAVYAGYEFAKYPEQRDLIITRDLALVELIDAAEQYFADHES